MVQWHVTILDMADHMGFVDSPVHCSGSTGVA